MTRSKFFQIIVSATLIASFLFGGSISAGAQGEDPPPDTKAGRITVEERLAAAERSKALGLELPKLGEAEMAGQTQEAQQAPAGRMGAPGTTPGDTPGDQPRYYGPFPNYANSPLRMSDVLVSFTGGGGGTGAAASAVADLYTGEILELLLDAGGSGYTEAPTVVLDSAIATTALI